MAGEQVKQNLSVLRNKSLQCASYSFSLIKPNKYNLTILSQKKLVCFSLQVKERLYLIIVFDLLFIIQLDMTRTIAIMNP